jgi:hypothetical protein
MWQPIATAPKDGTPVLLYLSGEAPDSAIEIGVYLIPENGGDVGWHTLWDHTPLDGNRHGKAGVRWEPPTHWMPLPSQPTDV